MTLFDESAPRNRESLHMDTFRRGRDGKAYLAPSYESYRVQWDLEGSREPTKEPR